MKFQNPKNLKLIILKYRNLDNLNIIKIRNEMGLTIQQFANLVEMDRRSISNWESGKVKIPESKIKLVEFLVEKNKIKSTADSNVVNSNDNSMENFNNEIMYLKDHIKTLKESLDDKNKIARMYNSEITSLKEKLAFFNNKES